MFNLVFINFVRTPPPPPSCAYSLATVTCCRKWLFEGGAEDPDYAPLAEERPGGFEWGVGAEVGADQQQPRHRAPHQNDDDSDNDL